MSLMIPIVCAIFLPVTENANVLFAREHSFRMPVRLDERKNYVGAQLWISFDRGQSWTLHDVIDKNADAFQFTASRDGSHWFAVQAIRKDGQLDPPTIERRDQVALRVYVNQGNRLVAREVTDVRSLITQVQKRLSTIAKIFE